MLASIRHGFSNLCRFSGRDRRGRFWPFAGLVVIGGLIGMNLAILPIFTAAFVAADPFADGGSGFRPFFWIMGAGTAAIVALLAAAVTRRLHDIGRSGLWGLPPAVFLAIGLALFPVLFEGAIAGDEATMFLFLPLFANNLAYMASLVMLVVFLCRAGQPDDNRYGPEA